MDAEQYARWASIGGAGERLAMKAALLKSEIMREFVHRILPPSADVLRQMDARDAKYRAIEDELLAYEAEESEGK